MLTLAFVISHVIPADPAARVAGLQASREAIEAVRREFGLDRPLHEQYIIYMTNLFQGNLGTSLFTRQPVVRDLARYWPATIELTTFAMLISIIIGVPIGVVSATKRDKIPDHLSRVFAFAGVSMPGFWLALIVQLIFFSELHIIPFGGRIGTSPPQQITGLYLVDSVVTGNIRAFASSVYHLLAPGIVLSYLSMARIVRLTRASMIESMSQDYIVSARSKGLPERRVVYGHALRNSLIAVTTIVGLNYGMLLGGAVLVEHIFAWPGLGRYAVNTVQFLDFNGIMGVTLLLGLIYVSINLIIDILYHFLDPRVRMDVKG
jgi:peptide/nickel transport system permease protein